MKNLMKLSLVLVVASMTMTSCQCFKKMSKNASEVSIKATPEVMELKKDIIAVDLTVTFPVNYFDKKAIVKATPVLVYNGGEVAAAPRYLQGTKVKDNYPVVDKTGGVYNMHVEFPYNEKMGSDSWMEVRVEVKCGEGDFYHVAIDKAAKDEYASAVKGTMARVSANGDLIVAQGLNLMQKDLKYESVMDNMPNNYKKVTTIVDKADIKYAINDSRVNKNALKKNEEVKAFQQNVEQTLKNDRATQHISVKGYASPDGPETLNDKLSGARSQSGKEAAAELLKDSGLEIDAAAYGEDWDGFKELVEKSNIRDKHLILQVLSLYSTAAQRESEIKNMSAVFNELKTDVLPQLRRAQLINTMDIEGKTDAEILALIYNQKYDQLSNEELLYAAETLLKSNDKKIDVLAYTAKEYNDARAYNNLGVAQAVAGDHEAALKSFEKAMKANGADATTVSKNLTLSNLSNGNYDEAKKFAQTADNSTKAALAAAEGNYDEAAKNLTGYNAAVAYVMNNNLTAAKKALTGEDSADADYLRAIIASKEGNMKDAEAQLRSAIAKDSTLAKKALTDVNLRNLMNSGFKF